MNERKLAAFTLLELLVAICVVVVLAALLGGVTLRSLKISSVAKCTMNLRQIAGALLISAGDRNNTFLPYAARETDVPGEYEDRWSAVLIERGYLSPGSDIFRCPAFPANTDLKTNWSVSMQAGSRWVHYGYNNSHVGGSFRYGGEKFKAARLAELTVPSRTILLADSLRPTPSGPRGGYILEDRKGSDYIPDARHEGRLTVAFADGHVEAIPIADKENPWKELGSAMAADSLWKR